MKKRILAAFLAVLMMLPMALGILAAEEEKEKINYVKAVWESKEHRLSAMEKIASSPDGNLELYVDRGSGEMGIKNLRTGDIVLSNPYDISSSTLLTREKPYALSQVDLTFTYISTGETKTMHSYSDCFIADQAKIETLTTGNGIKVYYMLGVQDTRLLVPNKISVEDFEAVLSQIEAAIVPEIEAELQKKAEQTGKPYTEKELNAKIKERYNNIRRKILGAYTLFDPENFSANKAAAAIREYPICATTPIYVIQTVGSGNQFIEDYLKKYTNYTFEKLDADYKKVEEKGIDDFSTAARPKFELTATYEITNTGLVATVDAGSLVYDTTLYNVKSISLLPYFNAANAQKTVKVNGQSVTTTDYGYTFIPDGSGVLVRFEDLYAENNTQVKMENAMYGNDYAYYQVKNKNTENLTMPVFGLSNHSAKTGFLAIIEDGDAMSTVVSNHSTAYHSIYPTFSITPSDVYDLADSFSGGSSSSKKIGIVAEKVYKGKCTVNYSLLVDDEKAQAAGLEKYYSNTYVGMAKMYREYLEEKGAISKLTDAQINKDFTKLFLEAFGSIKVEEKIATFPVTVNKELTTFEDIKSIHADLKASGVGNTSFILKGFANGGLLSKYPTKVKWQKVLGGEKGFKDLLEYAEENNFDVAPDVEFSYSYGSFAFSGFTNKKYGVRTLDNRYTTKRIYYAATQTFERTGGVAVSSASFDYVYEKFYKSIEDLEIKCLSVRSLGSDLNSDFDEDDYYTREEAKDEVVAMLKLLKGSSGNKSYNLVLDAGNSYAIPYANAILSASLDSSRRREMSESVPFFGMVYHGSIEFAGNAFNMEGDTEYAFLKAIENGANLYFTIAKQNVELLKFEEEYNKYYSVSYDNLKNTIVQTYQSYNAIMKDLQNKYIVDHGFIDATRVEDGGAVDSSLVVMVEYEGGVAFVLNYSSYDINVTLPNGESKTIAPFGYVRFTK